MKMLMIGLLRRDDGQDLIEYGLLLGIITLASVLAAVSIGGKVSTYFGSVNALMP
jgi:pilus assembly protein Flp/PilA